jgi:hypothetical protein
MTAIKQSTPTTTSTTMFSFLNQGDINNTIRAITNLPGLFTSDGDKIKYAALNHATAMRHNLHNGVPIFTNIRAREAEIERRDINSIVSGHLPSATTSENAKTTPTAAASAFTDNGELRCDNATLALIMAKELSFLNRSIQMISLIARRYQEEQDDLAWGKNYTEGGDIEEGGISGSGSSSCSEEDTLEPEASFEDTPCIRGLQRSSSSPSVSSSPYYNSGHRPENQLVATFLIATGRLCGRFENLCRLVETSIVHVHAMTTQDKPHSEANREKQLMAERLVISDIYMFFSKFDAEHRDPVVWAFLELRDISVSVWKIMSMFAFSNLFRLTEGTDFAIYKPEDAIFTDGQVYTLALPQREAAVVEWRFSKTEQQEQEQEEAEAIAYD